ncbi:GntR family transcriptional regulator [Kitasatospora sp. NBC_00240]|uniref:GntR family transcriptional regulator n=1 Tax=Kitasatospora sp. NBC_00240 TaxID=2903567 RepID=UPI0022531D01|nr:GntR family transcriptional regulator [Kitasatospora sp. NBC_00240]MCX5216186.1 GntR family transcriptional regulator [Kitasatospora sp. NBC_00240]
MSIPPSRHVADELRREITAGVHQPGQYLPSSRALADRFKVARDTVAAGVAILVAEGLVAAIPKKGYQVLAAPTAIEIQWTPDGRIAPAGEPMLGAGDGLRVEVRRASDRIASLLQGTPQMSVVLRSELHSRAGSPWALREVHFPQAVADLARRLALPDPADETRILAEAGLGETGYRTRWSARPASKEEAALLKSGAAPVHTIERVGYHGATPVRCELILIRADRVYLSQSGGDVPFEATSPHG